MIVLLSFFKKYWIYIIFVSIISYQAIDNHSLRGEIVHIKEKLVEEDRLKNEAIQKASLIESRLTLKYSEEAKKREEYYANEYKKLLDDYNRVQSVTNSRLSTVTSKIRDRVSDPSVSTTTKIEYLDRYQTVFTECLHETTELVRLLRQVGIERDFYKTQLDDYYAQYLEYVALNEQTIIK